ncbi:AAA family ATPase [Alloscardovia omnicolens]|uniref:AAA family ATPase n=1 Tax=Alloscardovia omnicolens TaxID=419015 RepID=UPI00242E1AC3|nr:AAA family ATPase [Alloscardovia omnicolens]
MTLEITPEFRNALDLLSAGSNLFLTGKAGTGKSTLIRHFIESSNGRVIVAAPTGIAALNVGGYTLHRLFGFRPGTTVEDIRSGRAKPGRMKSAISKLKTLIIDEVSMVRADIFDQVATSLEMYGPKPGEPFGGVQIVLVGDVFQLPPVVRDDEEEYFSNRYETPYFFSADHFTRDSFPIVHLTKIFRQVGDPQMVDLLNHIRDGRMNRATQDSLNAKLNPDFQPPRDELWVTLATTNNIVKSRNNRRLEELSTTLITCVGQVFGDQDGFELPTDESLNFKVGAQIMMLTNDSSGRWVNGTMGRIIDVQKNGISLLDNRDSVFFDDKIVISADEDGLSVIIECEDGNLIEVESHLWEITRPRVSNGVLSQDVVGSFEQLPFKLAWAITIHKSQGQTLEHAIIDLSGGTRATGQLYVALSRCTSLDGLVLTRRIYPKDVKIDHRVRQFLNSEHSATASNFRAVECLLVGHGDGYIRPIDIAVSGENGIEAQTLLNPTRDLGTSAQDYNLTASMLQIAPTLAEAWPAIEEAIGGFGLVSSQPDALKILDDELKRTGIVTGLNDIAAIHGKAIYRTAQECASATWTTFSQRKKQPSVEQYSPLDEQSVGYTMGRDMVIVPFGNPAEVATLLTNKLAKLQISAETRKTVADFESRYGVHVDLPEASDEPQMEDILQPGARVCFTGTAIVDGILYERPEMEDLALAAGLAVAPSVSKTRCDALVAADIATQSGKARKAAEFGKPIFSAEEFVHWADNVEGR